MLYSPPERLFKRILWIIITFLIFSSSTYSNLVIHKNSTNHLSNYEFLNNTNDTSERFEGYNLYVLESKDLSNFEVLNRTLLITDLDGEVYFSRDVGTTDTLDTRPVEFINSTTILYGTELKTYLWNLESNTTVELNFWSHHDTEYNYVDDTYFTLKTYNTVYNDRTYKFEYINEYTAEGDLVWFLDTRSFINYSQWCPFGDASPPFDQYGGVRNVVHANTVFYDEVEDIIYLNCRNVNTFYKINHENKEVLWGLGEHGNFTMFDIYGNEKEHLFFHAHSLEKIDDNKFILFDNDFHNQTDPLNQLSRMLEITIDEGKMYANITREWKAPSNYFSISYGDCDLLPNDNLLGVFGTYTHPDSVYGAIITEVDMNGDIQWEITYPNTGEESFEVFQIERFRFAPIVSKPRLVDEGDGTGYLEWDVWYNFRSKTKFVGHYYITINNQTLEDGEIEFPYFWQATQVRYYMDELPGGEHDISLVVSDEGGHLSNESEISNYPGSINLNRRGLILGLSIGGGSSSLFTIVIYLKYFRKKSLFRKKKSN